MAKRKLSYLVISITLVATSLVTSYQHQSKAEQSSVMYESRRPILQEMSYKAGDLSNLQVMSNDISNIDESVSPIYTVGEREVCGIQVTDLKIEVKKEKKEEKKITNRWNITLTSDEIDLLAKIVWAEARGESSKGECSVVEVIFNRMIYPEEFSGSLYEVLSQRNQFQSWGIRNDAEPTDKEYENIKAVLNGETDILGFDYVYFSTSPRNNNGAIQIGNHWFCKYEYID